MATKGRIAPTTVNRRAKNCAKATPARKPVCSSVVVVARAVRVTTDLLRNGTNLVPRQTPRLIRASRRAFPSRHRDRESDSKVRVVPLRWNTSSYEYK